MTKKSSTLSLTVLLLVYPNFAVGADNGPVEITIGILGMLLIAAIGLYYTYKAEEGAKDPNNYSFSDANDLNIKLKAHLNSAVLYRLEVVRQSGNVERALEPISAEQAISHIASTMRRARIHVVSIATSGRSVKVYRTVHNGRGRQEGKRIGGFELTPIG